MGKKRVPKKAVTKAITPEIVANNDYHVSLTCGDTVFEGRGVSIIEAFQNLPQPPARIFLKGILKVSHGGKVSEKLLYPNQIRKILGYKLQRAVQAKLFSYYFMA